MNQLRRSRITRVISPLLVAAMLMPMGIIARPSGAEAQTMATMAVGVVDFANESGVQGEILSRMATDAVVVELSKRFDVITRSQLEQQMEALGLKPPLSRIGLIRLGEALSADAMIEGAITSVRVSGQGAARKAAVTLVIRLLDQASGEVLNGAIQTGYSNPRVGQAADDDTLITEAISNAAYLAVKTMMEYIIPEATVQSTIGTNEVMLNRGSRDGIKRGMRMIVTRDREIIGYLQVTSVSANDSRATVTKAMRGVRPEDKAKAIFDMPAAVRGEPEAGLPAGAPPAKRISGTSLGRIGKLLLAGLAVFGLIKAFDPDNKQSVGATAAQAFVDGSGTPTVEVGWDPKSLQRGTRVRQYKVFRSLGDPAPVAVASPGQRVAVDPVGPARTVDYEWADTAHALQTATANVPALLPGTSNQYYVSAVYEVDSLSQKATQYYETERKFAGQATPIDRPVILGMSSGDNDVEGTDSVDLRKVTFAWQSTLGADTYTIEVSTDPSFSSKLGLWELPTPVVTSPRSSGERLTRQVVQALFDQFGGKSQTLYWRVGARNSRDNPGPKPWPGRPNARWIYSDPPMSFTTVELPPPQPGG